MRETVKRAHAIVRLGWLLFLRDFRLRFRQTYLGYFWAVGKVLFGGLPLILVGSSFNLGGDRSKGEYAVYALAGLIAWQIFWDAVVSPQWVARRMRRMLADLALPVEAILVAGCWYVLFHAAIYVVLVAAALAVFRLPPPLTLPLGLLALPALVFAGVAIGMWFVPLTFVYLDFRYGLPFLSPVLLWTAPIFYEMPQQGLLRQVNLWNPLTYLVDNPRQWLVEGLTGHDLAFVACMVAFAVLFAVGLRFYRRAMPIAVERLPQR